MAAGTNDITIEAGSAFSMSLLYEDPNGNPYDLSGAQAYMQVRQAKVVDPTNAPAPLISLSSLDSLGEGATPSIILGGTAGTIAVFINRDLTGALTIKKGFYDLYVAFSELNVVRVIEGKVTVDPTTTVVPDGLPFG